MVGGTERDHKGMGVLPQRPGVCVCVKWGLQMWMQPPVHCEVVGFSKHLSRNKLLLKEMPHDSRKKKNYSYFVVEIDFVFDILGNEMGFYNFPSKLILRHL